MKFLSSSESIISFANGMCSRFSVLPAGGVRRLGLQNDGYMEKIQFQTTGVVRKGGNDAPFYVFARFVANVPSRLWAWYNSRSEFFSQVLGESCSWKTAIRVNLITLLCFVVAFCALENLMVTGLSLAAAGWLTYRLNVDDAQAESQKKKGGKR